MLFALWLIALVAAAVLAVPALVYAIECIAGSLRYVPVKYPADHPRGPLAILVPAHDEERGIARTVMSIRAQMRSGDRLVVVADNCSDATASIARSMGAEVVERSDPLHRGKGYAVQFGLDYLSAEPKAAVVFIDADCILTAGTLDELARAVEATGRPIQSCNLMMTSERTRGGLGLAEFAFRIKNLVRPRGMKRLGLPCLLTGTGMAMPWPLISRVRLAQQNLVEDMKLGIDLAGAGFSPTYCEQAGVRSYFPETSVGVSSQRNRWETGHLAMLVACLPSLLSPKALSNRDYLVLVLDVLVPPLTLLAFVQAVAILATLALAIAGVGWAPFVLAAGAAFVLGGATVIAWYAHGRDIVPPDRLLRVPGYMLGKSQLYLRALRGRAEQMWVRTDRNGV